jgi:hypothetical protein
LQLLDDGLEVFDLDDNSHLAHQAVQQRQDDPRRP